MPFFLFLTFATSMPLSKTLPAAPLIHRLDSPRSSSEVESILNPLVRRWFFSRFKEFSLPQLFGVIPIHQRENILVSAPTGATKTLTAFLSVLNELVDSAKKGILEDRVYCVYISPLKALNNDIQKNLVEPLQEIEALLEGEIKKLGIRVAVRTGDTTAHEKTKMLAKPPHILITTPESLAIMLSSEKFSAHLEQVEWCIVDEVHALAESKRGVHLSLSLERLQCKSPGLCRVGLSATVAPLEQVAGFVAGNGRACKIVDVQFLKELDVQVLVPVDNLMGGDYADMHERMYTLIDELVQAHRTTLIFTNTRSATERVVDYLKHKYPGKYAANIGAHHGSLGKEARHSIEERLRKGELKCVVSSTSLELGIDIGYIDLVLCLGSPKSVARFLQRAGRSGHRLHQTVKARIIVLGRDDLVECAVLVKAAREKKIDRMHIPMNCLDVLAQHVLGMAIERVWDEQELFLAVKKSYCYQNLSRKDFGEILAYLAGEFVDLEERHVFARIWRKEGKVGRRGKLCRVLYMMNVGTIPDESFITVKVGDHVVGTLDEGFLERLKSGDVFVLGGETYQFRFARGMVAQVAVSAQRPPNVPSWVSEMLPLSFDLACSVGRLRRLVGEKLSAGRADVVSFVKSLLDTSESVASAITSYMEEQHRYCGRVPSDSLLVLEQCSDGKDTRTVVHCLFGRRVNDCLSRAIAYTLGRTAHRDVEIGINDNGFVVANVTAPDVARAFGLLKSDRLGDIMRLAVEATEAYKRRFRHCATRALLILRNYMGHQKRVGRQQVSSNILMSALKRISPDFSILREARRECLEDLMDIAGASEILARIERKEIRVESIQTQVPSPFALLIAMQGRLDVLRIEERHEFLRRMHQLILASIQLDEGKRLRKKEPEKSLPTRYEEVWMKEDELAVKARTESILSVKDLIHNLKTPVFVKRELGRLLEENTEFHETHSEFRQWCRDNAELMRVWPPQLRRLVKI